MKTRLYENDYENIMNFLRETYREASLPQNWLPQRWEFTDKYINYIGLEQGHEDIHKIMRIWEENNKITAIVHKEETNNCFLQIRPGYEYLIDEMLDFGEEYITLAENDSIKRLRVWAVESKEELTSALLKRGFKKGSDGDNRNRQKLTGVYQPALHSDYEFTDGNDNTLTIDDIYTVNRQCFHPAVVKPVKAPKSFHMMEQAPLFNKHLQIMTRHKESRELTSYCVAWYDEKTKMGMFEPVGTLCSHRRKGLGKAMLTEGLHRLKEMGAQWAYVDAYADHRKAFYNSAGFETFDKEWFWIKEYK